MKKLVLLCSFICFSLFSTVVNAQLLESGSSNSHEQNSRFVGINLGYEKFIDMPDNFSITNYSFNADFGSFLIKNLAMYATFGGACMKSEYPELVEHSYKEQIWIPPYYGRYTYRKGYYQTITSKKTEMENATSTDFMFRFGVGMRYYIMNPVFVGIQLSEITKDFSSCSNYLVFYLGGAIPIKDRFSAEGSVGYMKGFGSTKDSKAFQAKIGVSISF